MIGVGSKPTVPTWYVEPTKGPIQHFQERRGSGLWLFGARSQLQPQLSRAVLSEDIAVSDVAPEHLNRPMAGLLHDGPFRRPSNCGGGCMTGPERMTRVRRSV